jgi:hypothetical protein
MYRVKMNKPNIVINTFSQSFQKKQAQLFAAPVFYN